MRILFCTTDGSHAINGINAWLLRFLPSLTALGHEPEVLVFPWSPEYQCTTTRLLRLAGIRTTVVYPMLYSEAGVKRCLQEIHKRMPEVFVANMVMPALLAMPRIRAMGIPCVSVLHNDDDEYRAKASFPTDATVVISEGLARLVPADGRIVRTIFYGTPISSRTTHWPNNNCLRLIYHGRIAITQKQILHTAAAFTRVCKNNPGLTADIYGSGQDELALRNQLARDDAKGHVRFLGFRSPAEILELLPDYHIAVLLSDYEGLGLAILEAMSAGLVPICLATPSGLPDIIKHGINGFFVNDRSDDFSNSVNRLVYEPIMWRNLSLEARRTIEERFSSSHSANGWHKLFQELTQSNRTAPLVSSSLPAPLPALVNEDIRHPGLVHAWWRRLRFFRSHGYRPW
ncbi:MAG: glycosyltransferase family 4 protein [Blastochloris sp.]|nr:glycosyltransferase family 4 protein [Blastochloris sp.]